jgi:opacity protein-like surface antigen
MKKSNLSLASLLALSIISTSNAEEIPILNEFYVGGAYGLLQASYKEDLSFENILNLSSENDFPQAMLQVGYKINPYFAFEGRYWIGMTEESWKDSIDIGAEAQLNTWGLYGKFLLPVLNDSFNVYTILGYAEANYEIKSTHIEGGTDTMDGLSWGLGTDLYFSDNVSVFIDYVSIYNNSFENYRKNNTNISIDTLNLGMSFTF